MPTESRHERSRAATSACIQPASGRSPQQAIILGIILGCQLMIVVDSTVIYTALPSIRTALDFSLSDLSWVQNAYTLTFGGLLLLGARTGDILGRRHVFIVAMALFTVASILGGMAGSAAWLIVARAAQGIAAAFAAPSALALLMTSFPESRERAHALKLYVAVSGAGSALGLVVGGALAELLSWRWLLYLNVPIGVALLVLALFYLFDTERCRGRFDLSGAMTATVGMSALVYGLVQASSYGWSAASAYASLLVGTASLILFVIIETRVEQPLVPLRLFASSERSSAYICRMLLVAGMLGTFFFLAQYVQDVMGYSALEAGIAFLPLATTQFAMVTLIGPRLAPLIGNARLLAGGFAVALLGMALLSRIGTGASFFPELAMALVILGIGAGATLVPLTAGGIADVASHDAGAASGLVNAAHQIGGSLGTAILVAIAGMASWRAESHAPSIDLTIDTRRALAEALSISATVSMVFFTLAFGVVLFTARHQSRYQARG